MSNSKEKKNKASKQTSVSFDASDSFLFLYQFCRVLGLAFLAFWKDIRQGFVRFSNKCLKKPLYHVGMLWLRLFKWGSRVKNAFLSWLFAFLKFFADVSRVLRKGYHAHPEESFPHRMKDVGHAFVRGSRNNAHIFLVIANYALPVLAAFAVFHVVSYVNTLNFAVNVNYNGYDIGYVQDESVYDQAENRLQQQISYSKNSKNNVLSRIPRFAIRVADPSGMRSASQLTDTIIESSNANIIQATGIFVNGKFLGAVKKADAVRDLLAGQLDKYKTNKPNERVEFTKDIELQSGLYFSDSMTNENQILKLFGANEQQELFYTVVTGDTPSLIAQKNGMSLSRLVSLNPNIMTNCLIGQRVTINRSKPYLSVKSVRTEVYTQLIPFVTEYSVSKRIYKGQTKVLYYGKSGKQSVTAEVSYVDGTEIGRKVLSMVEVSQPIAKQIAKGIKAIPKISYSIGPTSNYGCSYPIPGGGSYISQGYGHTSFSSWHNGIDIAFHGNGYGRAITSILPGRVVYAGWSGTYGNLIRVRHANGLESWYAHCSRIVVSTGDSVAQGQQIGNVGSTGNATGNHLHLRVIANGVEQNPLKYV